MKIAAAKVDAFVRTPAHEARVILVYGPDTGQVRERASALGRLIVRDLNDPFNVAVLSNKVLADDPARLQDEAMAFSMLGGARLITIDDADDALTPLLKTYMAQPSLANLVVMQGGNLGAKSSLRALCEKSPFAASLPCYVDEGGNLAGLIRETFKAANISVEPDALTWLATAIMGDRQRVRSELAKILTYLGNDRVLTLTAARMCCADTGTETLDELINAVVAGNGDAAVDAYYRLTAAGINFVAMLRTLQAHFRKLHLAVSRFETGMPIDKVVGMASPPIFFKAIDAFKAQLRLWSLSQLEIALQKLTQLEAQAKQTGVPLNVLGAQAMLSMSRMRRR